MAPSGALEAIQMIRAVGLMDFLAIGLKVEGDMGKWETIDVMSLNLALMVQLHFLRQRSNFFTFCLH